MCPPRLPVCLRAATSRGLARRRGLDEDLSLATVAQRVMQGGSRWEFTDYLGRQLDALGQPGGPVVFSNELWNAPSNLSGLGHPAMFTQQLGAHGQPYAVVHKEAAKVAILRVDLQGRQVVADGFLENRRGGGMLLAFLQHGGRQTQRSAQVAGDGGRVGRLGCELAPDLDGPAVG